MPERILSFFISFAFLMVAVSFHEFAHGFMAYKLGDNTAKYSGRLTLNPLAHIDIFWTVILPLLLFISTGGQFVFGAAKPVPINYWALKNPKKDIVLIGASGPAANLILAFVLSWARKLATVSSALDLILLQLIVINVVLGVFNLIPIPPLDGSRILSGLLPEEINRRYALIEPYAFFILLLLMWLGIINALIWPLVGLLLKLFGVA
jgi:Zn-dependent protease